MMKFQTKEGKIFNATSFNRFVSKMEQGVMYVAKVILDGETWVVNSSDNENEFKFKIINFVKKFKLPIKATKVERFIDEYESKDLYELTLDDCINHKYPW
jgi:hypothetical protein